MKKLLLTTVLSLISLISFAQNSDEEAIKKVLDAEIKGWHQRNYDQWASTYAQVPHTSFYWNNSDGTSNIYDGWEKISKTVAEAIQKDSKPWSTSVDRQNWLFVPLSPDVYWVTYNQTSTRQGERPIVSKDAKLMKKINGSWKIVSTVVMVNPKQL